MFRLLLLVYVMILDKIYIWRISTEDDIEKINYAGRQLGWAWAFRPDPRLHNFVFLSVTSPFILGPSRYAYMQISVYSWLVDI